MSKPTPSTPLFDKPFCKIYYHESLRAVHLDWGRFSSPEEFKEACDFSLKLLIERHANKIIADNSKVAVVSIENQNWLTNDWFPRALKEGFKYSAVVVNDDFYVNYAVKRIEKNIKDDSFQVNYFTDFEEAKAWLASQS